MKLTIPAMAALLVAALAACSGDDDQLVAFEVSPLEKEYTLSVETAKGIGVVVGDLQSQTRALTQSGSTLNASWATTDRVYVQKGGTWATGSLQPQTAGATATLKGSLTGVAIAVDEELILQFPKSGTPDYSGQKGTLEDIAANYDYATATATVRAVSANGMVAADAATFTNQQAIVRFTLLDAADGTTPVNATSLTVSDGTNTYTVNPAAATNDLYVAIPGFSGQTVTLKATAASGKYKFVKPAVSFTNGQYYEVTVKMEEPTWADVPGTLPGMFSVSASKKVWFSKGNLQAVFASAGSSCTWKFADNQWDCVGNAAANTKINGSGSVSQAGTVDLFGWNGASSSYDNYGINNSNTVADYGNTSGESLKHDWGTLAITNGGAAANSGWRTLSGLSGKYTGEWYYLFNTRSASTVCGTANARFAKAYLFGTKHGVILFPDHYTHPDGVAAPTGINDTSNTSWNDNQYSAADWAKMEAAGAVFLPAAGYRDKTTIYSEYAYYWSSTADGNEKACYMSVYSDNILASNTSRNRYWGLAVRLVRDAN